jgi:hypothetical protein
MEISITAYFLLPVAASVGMIVILWLYYGNRRLDEDKRGGEGMIYRCEHCQFVYVERRLYPLLECPRCHHPNPAIRR